MPDAEQVPFRQRLCRGQWCGAVFYVCRSCDRGQRYCSERCRCKARREQRRAANRRHQRSEAGRLDHRDRQREYRLRLAARRVTDQGSGEYLGSSTLPALVLPPVEIVGGGVICCVCGRIGTLIDPFTG
jgi:hypothetical protein